MRYPLSYRVTRDVGQTDRHNYAGRDVKAGEILYRALKCTYNCVDTNGGIALTEKPDGDYPFFEFPLDAVEPCESS